MLYCHVKWTLFPQNVNKTSHSNSGREHTTSSLERGGRKSHSGSFPDFLGAAVTLWAAFECRAKTLPFDLMDMKTMPYKNCVEKNPS